MSCRRFADAADRYGRALPADVLRELDAHLPDCGDCADERNARQVSRIAFEVGGRLPAPPTPLSAADLLAAAAAERARPPDLLAEVIPIAHRWLPRLAAAAAILFGVATGLLERDARLGAPIDVPLALLVEPEAVLGGDAALSAVLSAENGS